MRKLQGDAARAYWISDKVKTGIFESDHLE
jgi:hypothetical protein